MKKITFVFLLLVVSVLISAVGSSADSGKLYPIGQQPSQPIPQFNPPGPGGHPGPPSQQPQQPKPQPWQPWQQPQPWQPQQPKPQPPHPQQPQPWQPQPPKPQQPQPWQPQPPRPQQPQPWQPQPPRPQQPQPWQPGSRQDSNVSVTTQRSHNNTINLTWTIRNVTNETWGSKNVDILCTAGCHLLTDRNRYRWDLPYSVKRNGMLSFTVNIQPYRPGETMTFAMVAGKQTLYSFNVRL